MYLLLDNTNDNFITLSYFINGEWREQVFVRETLGLLEAVDELLNKLDKQKTDLSGLLVLTGRGRFTTTRVAVTVANTVAYALKIPVASITEFTAQDPRPILQAVPLGQYASATYSSEPRIGK